MANKYITYRCPLCGRKLFDASSDSKFRIRIRCSQCRNLIEIDGSAGPETHALALLQKNQYRKCG